MAVFNKKRAIRFIVKCIRIWLELLSQIIFKLKYWGFTHPTLPPIKNLLLLESASSLAVKIRARKVSSEEVVQAYISRIKEVNPILNAVVDNCFDEALENAKKVDELLKRSNEDPESLAKNKPFLGVPFTTKDCIKVKGLKQTAGLYLRKDMVASDDADSIHLLKEAGAIILGVTNTSELCMWWESSNKIYGETKNAYDTSKIVGGSSGGEGCILSAAGSPMGVGSDIGGSIRMPAFFNGIFGHKPSPGVVSNAGMEPLAVGKLNVFLTTGPMCRFAADLIPMYKVLASSNVHLLSLDKKVDLSQLKIYYMEDDGGGNVVVSPVEDELRTAQKKVLDHFKRAYNITPIKIKIREFAQSLLIFFVQLSSEKEAVSFCSELALKKGEINPYTELIKLIFRCSNHTFAALTLAFSEKYQASQEKSSDYQKLFNRCDKLRQELKSVLGTNGVLLYPSHPTTAPYHSQPLFRPYNFAYTAIFNVIDVAVTQCPLGLSSYGLPLGIQVVANKYHDHLSLAVAVELEKAFGGWVCPSQIL